MGLYEITRRGGLIPFRRMQPGRDDLYEDEIEELFWENPDEFLGESIFLVASRPTLPLGGEPDIVALDAQGRVLVVELKRHIDRGQLAQGLEYVGWGRTTNLDELAGMYDLGHDAFFEDWQEFTDTPAPVVVSPSPRLILVAQQLHVRTEQAFEALRETFPISFVSVSIYEDERGRRFLDVGSDYEPELEVAGEGSGHFKIDGRRVRITDLLDEGLLRAGDRLVWERPRLNERYRAQVMSNGMIQLSDRRRFASPSLAATEAAGIPAYDGWYAWHVTRLRGASLHDLRVKLLQRLRN